MQIMNMSGYVLMWYLLGVKVLWGHSHKARVWYHLGISFTTSDKHLHNFYMGIPPGGISPFDVFHSQVSHFRNDLRREDIMP